jgi:hypothetical protein
MGPHFAKKNPSLDPIQAQALANLDLFWFPFRRTYIRLKTEPRLTDSLNLIAIALQQISVDVYMPFSAKCRVGNE